MKGRLIEFRGKNAIIQLENDHILQWPIHNLANDIEIGDEFYLDLITLKTKEQENYKRMQKLLQDLIN